MSPTFCSTLNQRKFKQPFHQPSNTSSVSFTVHLQAKCSHPSLIPAKSRQPRSLAQTPTHLDRYRNPALQTGPRLALSTEPPTITSQLVPNSKVLHLTCMRSPSIPLVRFCALDTVHLWRTGTTRVSNILVGELTLS